MAAHDEEPTSLTHIASDEIQVPEAIRSVHRNPLLWPKPFASTLILGCSGSGKSHLLTCLVPDLTEDTKVLIVATRVKNNPMHLALMRYAEKRGWYHAIIDTPEILITTLNRLVKEEKLGPGKAGCVIFDDFDAQRGHKQYEAAIDQVVSQFRNHNVNIFIITQSPQNVSTVARNNCGAVISFLLQNRTSKQVCDWDIPVPDKAELAELMEDLSEWVEMPFCFRFCVKSPLRYGCGIGKRMALLADRNGVLVPSARETMALLKAHNDIEMSRKGAALQKKMGNDSDKL